MRCFHRPTEAADVFRESGSIRFLELSREGSSRCPLDIFHSEVVETLETLERFTIANVGKPNIDRDKRRRSEVLTETKDCHHKF